MILQSKLADEHRSSGPIECWCLHGAVGMAGDWRSFTKKLTDHGISTRAVDLWRFLDCCPMTLPQFGKALNAEVAGTPCHGTTRALLGYSMGGRMALHSLLESPHPWQTAIMVSTHPGLDDVAARSTRRAADTTWATRALAGDWQEFLHAWNSQDIFNGHVIRDISAAKNLITRRREIARSFVDWSLGMQDALWCRLDEISIPVLWIAGENDLKFLRLAERACSLMPHASLAIAPDTGHRVPWENEPWCTEQVARFLSLGYV